MEGLSTWSDATCQSSWGVSQTYSLGSYDSSTGAYRGGAGSCYSGSGRASSVTIIEDYAVTSQSASVVESPTCFYAITIRAPPQPCILAVGDSITQGRCTEVGGSCDPNKLSYLCTLQRDVLPFTARFAGPYTLPNGVQRTDYCFGAGMRHLAQWGASSGSILSNVNTALSTNAAFGCTPTVALIHAGSNDAPETEGNVTVANIQAMLTALRGHFPSLVARVGAIIPRTDKDVSSISNRIATHSWPEYVSVVRMDSAFDTAAMLWDHAHPNTAGQAFLANRWSAALPPSSPPPPSPPPPSLPAPPSLPGGLPSWHTIQDTYLDAVATFRFTESGPRLGMYRDSIALDGAGGYAGDLISIDATGFGLVGLCISARLGHTTRSSAAAQLRETLATFEAHVWPVRDRRSNSKL